MAGGEGVGKSSTTPYWAEMVGVLGIGEDFMEEVVNAMSRGVLENEAARTWSGVSGPLIFRRLRI